VAIVSRQPFRRGPLRRRPRTRAMHHALRRCRL